MVEKGLVQVYTGNGKGKTTAAIGQGIRAVGRGNTVYMIQFLKSGHTGEISTLKKLEPFFQLFRFEKPRGFVWTLNEEGKQELGNEIREAFEFASMCLLEKQCDVLILDEIFGALSNGFIKVEELLELLHEKPENVEIILTGRNVPAQVLSQVDYVSEINCVKHPFEKGIAAREGIEF